MRKASLIGLMAAALAGLGVRASAQPSSARDKAESCAADPEHCWDHGVPIGVVIGPVQENPDGTGTYCHLAKAPASANRKAPRTTVCEIVSKEEMAADRRRDRAFEAASLIVVGALIGAVLGGSGGGAALGAVVGAAAGYGIYRGLRALASLLS